MRPRPLTIFYIITFYVLIQVAWWFYLMIKLEPHRTSMWIGEGAVFFALLSIGAFFLRRAIIRQTEIARQQKNFLLSVTHELKSPLAAIKLYLETILKRDLDKTKMHLFMNNSLKDVERLNDLVENMLIATNIENKSYTFPKDEFNFSELVMEVVYRLDQLAIRQNIIKANVVQDEFLYGDKFALSLVVTNLIENAIKYSENGAPIEIILKREEESLIFSVADQGIGIAERDKERIFKRFYRLGNEETRKTKGTGLGLFIVKQVLDNHRAVIVVKDNAHKGTIFEVTFKNTPEQPNTLF